MTTQPATQEALQNAEESARVTRAVQRAADAAYAARVRRAFGARHDRGELAQMIDEMQESTLSNDDWKRLCRSCRSATAAEFAVFAAVLQVRAEWLAVGSGPVR